MSGEELTPQHFTAGDCGADAEMGPGEDRYVRLGFV